ncbi:MAG: hypothetical protein ACXW32_03185 [Limisphaerales bacterium]
MASTNSALVLPTQTSSTNLLDADIRPLKGPVEIAGSFDWLWWVAAALAAAIIGWFLWRKFRLKKNVMMAAVVVPPHRRAKDRLRGAGELMSDPYRFCSLVSDVLRAYVEERFELKAPERTTEEFMEELRSSTKLRGDHKLLLEDFLGRCDLVKFARFEPTLPELEALLDSAYRFVEETAPMDQPENNEAPQQPVV